MKNLCTAEDKFWLQNRFVMLYNPRNLLVTGIFFMKKTHIVLLLLIGLIVFLGGMIWQTLSLKRYVVFAGYNKDGVIAPYVLTYLKGLNEIADGVVYIADSELKEGEEKKLKGLVIHTEHKRHNEYDWGSYKRGFNWLKRKGYLSRAKELVFANDSTYAPLGGSFKPMFEKMDKRTDIDFWGDSQNKAFQPHVQSYFMVMRRNVFETWAFQRFMLGIEHLPYSSMYITEYEVALTTRLARLGFKWDSYIDYEHFPLEEGGKIVDINSYPLTAVRDFGHLFLKRRTFTTDLAILEDRGELLRYIAKVYPKNYQEIVCEIEQKFIPVELREERVR